MHTRALNAEVLSADDPIVLVSRGDVESLKASSLQNERKRMRLCAHPGVGDSLHEMLIVHARGAYVRPHKHLGKSESVHIIEGLVDVVVFDDSGNLKSVIRMGDYTSGLRFYYRMSEAFFHTFWIRSDMLVFHETTNGPFVRTDTIFAEWAPSEGDQVACDHFMQQVAQAVDQLSPM